MLKRQYALVFVALLFVACAGRVDPITVSATTAAIVGEQAVATNTLYSQLCATGQIPQPKCQAWATWFRGFQRDYAAAHAAFKAATTAGDITSAQDAANRIQTLANQLLLYAIYKDN